MSPKEKAKEIYNKYWGLLMMHNVLHRKLFTKECALIVVDEIIHNNNELNGFGDGWMYIEENTDYWQQVKQEINKL